MIRRLSRKGALIVCLITASVLIVYSISSLRCVNNTALLKQPPIPTNEPSVSSQSSFPMENEPIFLETGASSTTRYKSSLNEYSIDLPAASKIEIEKIGIGYNFRFKERKREPKLSVIAADAVFGGGDAPGEKISESVITVDNITAAKSIYRGKGIADLAPESTLIVVNFSVPSGKYYDLRFTFNNIDPISDRVSETLFDKLLTSFKIEKG